MVDEKHAARVKAATAKNMQELFYKMFVSFCPACKRRIMGASQRVNRMGLGSEEGEKEMSKQLDLICDKCKAVKEKLINDANNKNNN